MMVMADHLQKNARNRVRRQPQPGNRGLLRRREGSGQEYKLPVPDAVPTLQAVEMRPNKRPMMSDLRDSGEIEQDADMVLMPYR